MTKKRQPKPALGLYLLLGSALLLIAGLWLVTLVRLAPPPGGAKPGLPAAERAANQPASQPAIAPAHPAPAEVPAAAHSSPATTQPSSILQNEQKQPLVALIIDDIGYQLASGRRSIALPGAVTLAVLPFSPHARALANLALKEGKELMLHAPMEPGNAVRWEGGLSNDMDRAALRRSLAGMLQALPQVRGVNNHMGSALTANRQAMDWIMEELKQKGLYFVDSRTSAQSQAYPAALSRAVPTAKRDVFLDHDRSRDAIARQFALLIGKAKQNGFAVGIGHPYPETLDFLEQALPELAPLGVELVSVSQLLTLIEDTTQANPSRISPLP